MNADRLGIFVTLCENGEIDACNLYLAQKVREVVSELVIVINGRPTSSALADWKRVTGRVFVRENEGYDSGAFKQALEEFIGWEEVCGYEELVLVNDSCYGPIYPLSEMFDAMENRPLDFWGVTEQVPTRKNERFEDLNPYHVQSYFLVVRSRMLRSGAFKVFWDTLELSNVYELVVNNFELRFTKYFNALGYRSGAYIDCTAFVKSIEETHAYIFYDSYRLIAEHRCPLLKKKVFLCPHSEVLASNAGETARRTLDYITSETGYHEDLIWRHLIRKCSGTDLRTALHLNYIFPAAAPKAFPAGAQKRAIVIVCVHNPDFMREHLDYLKRLPFEVDVIVAADRQETIDGFSRRAGEGKISRASLIKDRRIVNVLRLSGELLAEYPYVCCISDEGLHDPGLDRRTIRSCVRDLWENTIAGEAYVAQVIDAFEANRRLGCLLVPGPYASKFFTRLSEMSSAFWCRTAAIAPLLKGDTACELHDLPEIVRGEGYYSGWVLTDAYASLYSCNYQFMTKGMIRNVLLNFDICDFRNLYQVNPDCLKFCKRNPELYIYGCGEYGYRCFHYLRERGIDVQGFLVSDGHRTQTAFLGRPVYNLSELPSIETAGILVALNEKNTQAVIPLLRERGLQNYIQFSEGR